MMHYLSIKDGSVMIQTHPPAALVPLPANTAKLLPPVVGALHRSFWAWGQAGISPGPITAGRVWFHTDGSLAFTYPNSQMPLPLMRVGQAPDLAAWLVLLDKWVETFVVIARARAVWSVADLAGALTFLTPAFLPRRLVQQPPDNWERVAGALAIAVADGPLLGPSQDRHWG